MEKRNTRRAFLGTAAVLGLSALLGMQSYAAKPVQPVGDVYTGEAISAIAAMPLSVPINLDLTIVKNRKLAGEVVLEGTAYQVKGTISASGNVNLQAKQPGGGNLVLKAKFTDEDEAEATPKTLEGTYKFTKGGDKGTFSAEAALLLD